MTRTCLLLSVVLLAMMEYAGTAAEPIDVGSRLELFVDGALVDKLTGDAELKLHRPTPGEVVLVTDQPWEGNTCAYYKIFQDGPIYRMYYRGSNHSSTKGKITHRQVACYAESKDGIHWTKPELGLFEFEGSKKNNIVWDGPGTHNFTPFKDPNPVCAADAQYKAIAGGYKRGLHVFKSPDGIHWSLITKELVITNGDFDSQNLAFWDPVDKIYREYHRKSRGGKRDIMTCTSKDFVKWTEPKFLEYPGAPKEHLYTNAVEPYARAPHILLGFPTRYHPERNSQVEPTFMASRDRQTFRRWTEALIPVTAPEERDGNRSNYMACGVLSLPNCPAELSVFGTEAYYAGTDSRLRRFIYRVDGFVSASAKQGSLVTQPIRFTGKKLVVNYATGAKGTLRVAITDVAGKPLSGFTSDECQALQDDQIAQAVSWKGGEVSKLVGKPVRLVFELKDADVYSFQFAE